MVSLEAGHERERKERLLTSWDSADAQRRESIALLTAHLAQHRPDLLYNVSWLDMELQRTMGLRPSTHDRNWTFTGALYFVFTIVTTIGYGSFRPHTTGGRAYTVAICLLGIGAFAVFVERCSSAFANAMNTLSRRCGVSLKYRIYVTLLAVVAYWMLGALAFDALAYAEGDHWGIPLSIYFAAVTFTTVGLGDYSLRWYGDLRVVEVISLIVFATAGLVLFVELANITARLLYVEGAKAVEVVERHGSTAASSAATVVEKVASIGSIRRTSIEAACTGAPISATTELADGHGKPPPEANTSWA
jgi:hypothetical protein